MICLGYDRQEKEREIQSYRARNPCIKHVVCFHPDGWEPLALQGAEYVTYAESIEYRFFYPLLQKLDDSWLIVYDEMARTKKRNDLTYHCLEKYSNQTKHIMLFEFFPFTEDPEEFMILADLVDFVRMHGRKWEPSVLEALDVSCKKKEIRLSKKTVSIPQGAKDIYISKVDALFEELGRKDPDTVPNALEIFVGKWKAKEIEIEESRTYVARNARFGKPSVQTFKRFKPCDKATLLDLPLRSRDLCDWIKLSGCREIEFISTGLSIDRVLYSQYEEWLRKVNEFYVSAGVQE